MFEASLVNDKARTARPYTVPLSLVLQLTAAAGAVAYPLWHIEALPVIRLQAPSPFRRAIELVDPKPVQAQPQVATYRRPVFHIPLRAPSQVPTAAIPIDAPQLEDAAAGPPGPFVPNFFPGTGGSGPMTATPPPQPPPVRPVPVQPVDKPTGPVRVGGKVRPPQLIQEIRPAYPALARAARVEGTVKIEAIIARDGTIRAARVVSGHPLLIGAALDAVRQWRYRATVLNDEPVEVALALDIHFTLAR